MMLLVMWIGGGLTALSLYSLQCFPEKLPPLELLAKVLPDSLVSIMVEPPMGAYAAAQLLSFVVGVLILMWFGVYLFGPWALRKFGVWFLVPFILLPPLVLALLGCPWNEAADKAELLETLWAVFFGFFVLWYAFVRSALTLAVKEG